MNAKLEPSTVAARVRARAAGAIATCAAGVVRTTRRRTGTAKR